MEKLQQTPVTEQEKRDALAAALASVTFARSAQMRLFLSYVCEREMAGKPEDLTEYQIAVNVLGRPKDFNLTDDSAVRNRAYELRQRLEKFYSTEQPESLVEIQIPRGAYVPNYLRRSGKATLVAEVVASHEPLNGSLLETEPITDKPNTQIARAWNFRPWNFRPWTILAIVLLSAGAGVWAGYYFGHPRPPSILKEAWGPLVLPGDELTISIATNLHFLVRQHIPQDTPLRSKAPPETASVYGEVRRPLEPGLPLFMHPAQFSIPLAEVVAAATLCRVRQMFGGSCRLLPESEAPIASLRGRNAALLGSGTNSSAAALLLKRFPYTIDFTADDQFAVMDQRNPKAKKAVYLVQPTGDPVSSQHYGLFTVISSVDPSGVGRRIIVFSGSSSAGVQAGTEFFSSANQMRSLVERFRSKGFSTFPPNYQVLIRCQTSGPRLVSYEYLTDAVLP